MQLDDDIYECIFDHYNIMEFHNTRMTARTLHKNASLKILMKQELNVQRDGLEEVEMDSAIKYIEVPQSITKKLQGNK